MLKYGCSHRSLFIVRDNEVKNTATSTLLAETIAPTAQSLREAQIVLLRGAAATVPFILMNSTTWSIDVAEKSSPSLSIMLMFLLDH